MKRRMSVKELVAVGSKQEVNFVLQPIKKSEEIISDQRQIIFRHAYMRMLHSAYYTRTYRFNYPYNIRVTNETN